MDMKEVLDLTEALSKRREGDRELQDLLNEMSQAVAEHMDVLKKVLTSVGKQATAEDIGAAFSKAFKDAIGDMPAPQFTVPEVTAPTINYTPPTSKRKGIDVDVKTAPNGAIQSMRLTFF